MSRFQIPLRLLAAAFAGWLFAAFLSWLNTFSLFSNLPTYIDYYLHVNILSTVISNILFIFLILVLPIYLGIVSTIVSMDQRNTAFFLLALPSGFLFLTGFCGYYLPEMIRADARCAVPDPPNLCGGNSFLLLIFWFIGSALVLLSSLITSHFIHAVRTRRQRKPEIGKEISS